MSTCLRPCGMNPIGDAANPWIWIRMWLWHYSS